MSGAEPVRELRHETTVFTQELRFNTPEDRRFRATFGGFYSELELAERNDFTYPGSVNAVCSARPASPKLPVHRRGYNSDPGPFPAGVIFRNDVLRTDEQSASSVRPAST